MPDPTARRLFCLIRFGGARVVVHSSALGETTQAAEAAALANVRRVVDEQGMSLDELEAATASLVIVSERRARREYPRAMRDYDALEAAIAEALAEELDALENTEAPEDLPCGHPAIQVWQDSDNTPHAVCAHGHNFHVYVYKSFPEWVADPDTVIVGGSASSASSAAANSSAANVDELEARRKQRANLEAQADGMAPPYPSEY